MASPNPNRNSKMIKTNLFDLVIRVLIFAKKVTVYGEATIVANVRGFAKYGH